MGSRPARQLVPVAGDPFAPGPGTSAAPGGGHLVALRRATPRPQADDHADQPEQGDGAGGQRDPRPGRGLGDRLDRARSPDPGGGHRPQHPVGVDDDPDGEHGGDADARDVRDDGDEARDPPRGDAAMAAAASARATALRPGATWAPVALILPAPSTASSTAPVTHGRNALTSSSPAPTSARRTTTPLDDRRLT